MAKGYVVIANGDTEGTVVSSFWEAYWLADELRTQGASLVRVFPVGRKAAVFALTQRPDTRPDDRASNTVDPGLWDAVMELTKRKR